MVMLGQNAPTSSVQGPLGCEGAVSRAIASNRVNRQTKGLLNNGRNLSDARRGSLRRDVQAEAPGQPAPGPVWGNCVEKLRIE